MNKTSLKPSATLVALLLTVGTAMAQSTGATGGGTSGMGTSATGGQAAPRAQPGTGTRNSETAKDDKLARGDRKFIEEAAGSGMFEVQVSQLAATKATDPEVKSYASMLVNHHTAANSELTKLANARNVELPAAPPRALRRDLEQLGKKTGQEFDQDYVRNVGIKAHEKDIKMFEKASKDLKDPELKAFATKTLPTLKEHLAAAQKLPQAGSQDAKAPSRQGGSATMGNTGGGASTGSGGASGANKTGS